MIPPETNKPAKATNPNNSINDLPVFIFRKFKAKALEEIIILLLLLLFKMDIIFMILTVIWL